MELLKEQTTEEGLTSGQIVIIVARWILIVGALVLTLWNPSGIGEMWRVQVQTGLLLTYAVVNFFLHAQYIRQGEELPQVAYLTSFVDLVLITFVIAIQDAPINSPVYVFYLPAVLAISVAFPRNVAIAYVGVAVFAYGLLSIGAAGGEVTSAQMKDMVMRLVMIAAVGFTGGLFKHIEEQRWTGTSRAFSFTGGAPRTQRRRSTVTNAPRVSADGNGTPATATASNATEGGE
jgi:hypothetical protein